MVAGKVHLAASNPTPLLELGEASFGDIAATVAFLLPFAGDLILAPGRIRRAQPRSGVIRPRHHEFVPDTTTRSAHADLHRLG